MRGDRSGTAIYCLEHGCSAQEHQHWQRMLDIKPQQGLEIIDARHGERHQAFVKPKEILERLAGTVDGSAIVDYVRKTVYTGG